MFIHELWGFKPRLNLCTLCLWTSAWLKCDSNHCIKVKVAGKKAFKQRTIAVRLSGRCAKVDWLSIVSLSVCWSMTASLHNLSQWPLYIFFIESLWFWKAMREDEEMRLKTVACSHPCIILHFDALIKVRVHWLNHIYLPLFLTTCCSNHTLYKLLFCEHVTLHYDALKYPLLFVLSNSYLYDFLTTHPQPYKKFKWEQCRCLILLPCAWNYSLLISTHEHGLWKNNKDFGCDADVTTATIYEAWYTYFCDGCPSKYESLWSVNEVDVLPPLRRYLQYFILTVLLGLLNSWLQKANGRLIFHRRTIVHIGSTSCHEIPNA